MRHVIGSDTGPDAVRMYLNEIGQVDLARDIIRRRWQRLVQRH